MKLEFNLTLWIKGHDFVLVRYWRWAALMEKWDPAHTRNLLLKKKKGGKENLFGRVFFISKRKGQKTGP